MPELSLQLVVYLACVGALTVSTAVCDIRLKKIPNKITLPIFGAGVLYQLLFNQFGEGIGKPGLIDATAAFAAGFGMMWVLWMIGGGGGGDVKLMGALSVWIGFKPTCMVLVLSTIFVILGTVGVMAFSVLTHGLFRTKEVYLAGGQSPNGLPPAAETAVQRQSRRVMGYAPPVALATWIIVLAKLPKFPGF
ncbi:MAG: prepilin peptidase [Planctomycetaceae bacterium]|nr:prepilin peptidase [Planctomycetaceae bacterium]